MNVTTEKAGINFCLFCLLMFYKKAAYNILAFVNLRWV